MTDELKLLGCPFCGASAHVADTGNKWVCCNGCDGEGPVAYSEVEAIRLWNTRTPHREAGGEAVREVLEDRQRVVIEWGERCFGAEHMRDKIVRAARFFEEAAELAQAAGLPRDHALRAFDHVYSRPAGDLAQEVGGVANTLMALCGTLSLSFDDCQIAEIERCLAKDPSHFAKRNEAKLREVDALRSVPAVTGGEPVGWQRRFKILGDHWSDWDFSQHSAEDFKLKFGSQIENGTCEIRPVYALPAPKAAAEPVAWRMRYSDHRGGFTPWRYAQTKPEPYRKAEIEPLYGALPAPKAAGDEPFADFYGDLTNPAERRLFNRARDVRAAPMHADIAQIISEGWQNGKSASDIAEAVLREIDAPVQRAAVIEMCAKAIEPISLIMADRIRALSQAPATDVTFTQCEKCWQPATCKKYGCREPATDGAGSSHTRPDGNTQ